MFKFWISSCLNANVYHYLANKNKKKLEKEKASPFQMQLQTDSLTSHIGTFKQKLILESDSKWWIEIQFSNWWVFISLWTLKFSLENQTKVNSLLRSVWHKCTNFSLQQVKLLSTQAWPIFKKSLRDSGGFAIPFSVE